MGYLNQIGPVNATTASVFGGSLIVNAVAGDYFTISTNQTSGGNLNLLGGSNLNNFSCVLLGA